MIYLAVAGLLIYGLIGVPLIMRYFQRRLADIKVEVVSQCPPQPHMHAGDCGYKVRVTHVPTGITAQCGTERTQLANKAVAMRELAERLGQT